MAVKVPDDLPKLELAKFKTVTGPEVTVPVHFNPESLQYTVQNNLKEEGQGATKKQYVSQTTAKLTMQLVFDTTDTGEDVRTHTDKMAKLLKPIGNGDQKVPPQVEFSWGAYRFTGMVEQYKETIDFFSPSGVPLRSSVDLTLASQDVVFDSSLNPAASVDRDLKTGEPTMMAGPRSPADLAGSLGAPRSARAIAAANGAASLRFSAEAELAVGGQVNLQAAAAFSTGISVGAGIGLGGGIGIGASAGAGFGLGIGGGASAGFSAGGGFSAGASASLSAGAGAFADLRSGIRQSLAMPDASSLLTATANVSIGGATQFAPGGRAQTGASASLSADVGAGAELHSRISFQ